MRVVYFNLIPGEKPLAVMVTDEPVAGLKKRGAIPTKSVTLEVFINTDPSTATPEDEEEAAKAQHPNFCEFDNYDNPTKVVPDLERLQMMQMEDLRRQRATKLEQLDAIQLRALAEGRQDIVDEVNADKQALRDFPVTLRVKNPKRIGDLYIRDFGPLRVDYDAKYTARFKQK